MKGNYPLVAPLEKVYVCFLRLTIIIFTILGIMKKVLY